MLITILGHYHMIPLILIKVHFSIAKSQACLTLKIF